MRGGVNVFIHNARWPPIQHTHTHTRARTRTHSLTHSLTHAIVAVYKRLAYVCYADRCFFFCVLQDVPSSKISYSLVCVCVCVRARADMSKDIRILSPQSGRIAPRLSSTRRPAKHKALSTPCINRPNVFGILDVCVSVYACACVCACACVRACACVCVCVCVFLYSCRQLI